MEDLLTYFSNAQTVTGASTRVLSTDWIPLQVAMNLADGTGPVDVALNVSTTFAGGTYLRAQLCAVDATTGVTATSAVTFDIASPGTVNWASHGLPAGTPIVFTNSGGGLPAALTAGVVYYITNPVAAEFEVSATPGGASINFAGAGTGTHTATYTLAIDSTPEIPISALVSSAAVAGTPGGPGWMHLLRMSPQKAIATMNALRVQYLLTGTVTAGGMTARLLPMDSTVRPNKAYPIGHA